MKTSTSRFLQLILAAMLTLSVTAGFAESKESSGGEGKVGPAFYTMKPVVVNLAGQDIDHYLQVSIVFQADSENVVAKLKEYAPVIRSRAILVLSSKQKKDVDTLQGRQRLMDELVDMARVTLPPDAQAKNKSNGIEDVLLTAFVIQ